MSQFGSLGQRMGGGSRPSKCKVAHKQRRHRANRRRLHQTDPDRLEEHQDKKLDPRDID